MSEPCAWCGRHDGTVEKIEIKAGAYKTTRHPTTGQTAKICTRLPVTAWACGTHRGLALDGKFKAPRATKAGGRRARDADMNDERMVCRHCGGDKFHAEVTVSAWLNSTGVWVGDDGKPHFEPSGSPQDASSYEYDVESYVCSTCERSSLRLSELIVRAPKNGKAIAPCGRCDHSRVDHPEQRWIKPKGSPYTRGPMPCEHQGCDCHDYYDVSVVGQSLEDAAA